MGNSLALSVRVLQCGHQSPNLEGFHDTVRTGGCTDQRVDKCAWLNETKDFKSILVPLITQPGVKGPIVHDAKIAALCIAHGIDELLSKDRDFQFFGEITTRDPLV